MCHGLTQTRVLDKGRYHYLTIGLTESINAALCIVPTPQTVLEGRRHAVTPLSPDAAPTKEELVPSILCPGGPSRTGVVGTPSALIANDTAAHHHMTPSGANIVPRIYDTYFLVSHIVYTSHNLL